MKKILTILLLAFSLPSFGQMGLFRVIPHFTPPPPPPDTTPHTPVLFSHVNQEPQNLTAATDSTHYTAFGASYASDSTYAIVIRKATVHVHDPSSQMVTFETKDGGFTWTSRVLLEDGQYDCRNYGGGNTKNGKVFIFYAAWNGFSDWKYLGVMSSYDGGKTFTNTKNLPLLFANSTVFSPYGKLVETENGNLYQPIYLIDSANKYHNYFLKSVDTGRTWVKGAEINYPQDANIGLSETDIAYLGGGKMIAVQREDFGVTQKYANVANSSDTGNTWTSLGKSRYYGNYIRGGISPMVIKNSDTSVYFVSSERNTGVNFSGATLNFGDTAQAGLLRYFNKSSPTMDENYVDFGYPSPLLFSGSLDTNTLMEWYQTSTHWDFDSGGIKYDPHITDVWVAPMMSEKHFWGNLSNVSFSNGYYIDNTLTRYYNDEMSMYNYPYHYVIRKTANYTVHLVANFDSTNTSGTYRKFYIEKWDDVSHTLTATLDSFVYSNSTHLFDFTGTYTLEAGTEIGIRWASDGGSQTCKTMNLYIDKPYNN